MSNAPNYARESCYSGHGKLKVIFVSPPSGPGGRGREHDLGTFQYTLKLSGAKRLENFLVFSSGSTRFQYTLRNNFSIPCEIFQYTFQDFSIPYEIISVYPAK